MPREKRPKAKSMESLRHAEYYDRQRTFDELYARSQAGEIFDDLMDLILSRENIMLAYRNIKANSGSATPGTDRLRITDIGRLSADEVVARVRKIVNGGRNGYTPRSVRRKEIPKPNGKTRPLGIPCIWDRLIQQCIKQVMEPVCEAKFSSNSYGFRPNRSVENAIAAMYRLMQRSGLYYTAEKEAAAQAEQDRLKAEEEAKKAAEEAATSGEEQPKENKVTKIASGFLGVVVLIALAAGGIFYAFAKQKQKKQAEKEALDPDANYTEDKGDFEIPTEDEPEDTGEEDTEPI